MPAQGGSRVCRLRLPHQYRLPLHPRDPWRLHDFQPGPRSGCCQPGSSVPPLDADGPGQVDYRELHQRLRQGRAGLRPALLLRRWVRLLRLLRARGRGIKVWRQSRMFDDQNTYVTMTKAWGDIQIKRIISPGT